MTDRAFLKTFSGLLAALTVVIFVVAQMVTGSNKTKTASTFFGSIMGVLGSTV